jgi:hypothetical protein
LVVSEHLSQSGDSAELTVARWFAIEIIANEIGGVQPFPAEIRDAVAAEMVRDQDFLGWPDLEAAQATLDQWEWA